MKTVAALCVNPRGPYPRALGDDLCWDEKRDARGYIGPWPVVAHPPCARWCSLAGLVEARWGHKRGDDGGCFASVLGSVRKFGGVLEHPAYSAAWAAYGLRRPPTGGGWIVADDCGGYTCYVEQGRYGHPAKKATWLYANRTNLPELLWGAMPAGASTALVSWCGNHVKRREKAATWERGCEPNPATIPRCASGYGKERDVKISPETTSWLREPAAERYIKEQQKLVAAALETLLGTCSMSDDARVRELWARWKTLSEQLEFLVKARKESATDDD